jgi:large subunit ribosomal protein L4
MKAKVFSINGEEIKDITLNDDVFARNVSEGSIYYAIRNELANRRVGTASTKTRSEVRGSGAKPWSQKGTGHARAGSRKSPIWVGGGTVFGPRPRDYSYTMPRKMKRAALMSILSLKVKDQALVVVEDFNVESGKTKDLVKILKSLSAEGRAVVILQDDDKMIRRAARNIPGLSVLSYNRLNAHDLYYGKKIILLETAAGNLNDFYAKNGGK